MTPALAAVAISQASASLPARLRQAATSGAFQSLSAIGNLNCLQTRLLALLCSVRCPGSVILRTYDLAVALRDAGVPVIAGFHSPMEQECLRLLLRGAQPVIICPARGIQRMRVPPAWRQPIEQGRLLILSPFAEQECRVTRDLAERRNQLVASLADEVLVAHATPGGKTEILSRQLLAAGTPLLTLDCPENAHLVALGARPLTAQTLPTWLAAHPASQPPHP